MTNAERLEAKITEYLTAGGLFNPESMDHQQVRNLLMDCRAAFAVLKDAEQDKYRLDKLELFHREMDDWDRRTRNGKTMWVLFANRDVQGSTRAIIDAAINQSST